MKVTTTWLESRRETRNRPSHRKTFTVDGRQGLQVRVYPTGGCSFVYRFRMPGGGKDAGKPGGQRYLMVLGEFGTKDGLTLADAFESHHKAQQEVTRGLNPIEEREKRRKAEQDARVEREGADTVADLVDQFVHRKLRGEHWDDEATHWVRDAKARTRPRKRPEAAEQLLKSNLVDAKLDGQAVGKMKARVLTRRQLVRLLDAIVDRPAPVTANRVHALLVQMFNWAAARDDMPSPMAGIERPGGAEAPRKRTLSVDEIQAFWSKLDTAAMSDPTRLALKLLLVTAQRRGEITQAKWSHFDLKSKRWTIPTELLKSSHSRRESPEPHVVPLSALALELLQALHNLTGSGSYVLPAHADKRKDLPYSERVLSRAVRENAEHFGIPHFTPHDLRRTAASLMTALKVPRLHVEKVLNHSTGDIAEVYDRHDYLPEKRKALEKWSKRLDQIIKGKTAEAAKADRRA